MKKHLARFEFLALYIFYMAGLWGFVLLLVWILDADVNTVMVHFLAGVVVYLSVRDHVRS